MDPALSLESALHRQRGPQNKLFITQAFFSLVFFCCLTNNCHVSPNNQVLLSLLHHLCHSECGLKKTRSPHFFSGFYVFL